MARVLTKAEEVEKLSKTFAEISQDLEKCVQDMKLAEIPGVWLHSQTVQKKHLPEIWNWLASVERDVKSQIRAFEAGVKSKAESDVARSSRKKQARKKGS